MYSISSYQSFNSWALKRGLTHTFTDLDTCSVISLASDEIHCSQVNIFRNVLYRYFNKNLHNCMNKDSMYLHCYIYCGNYYWLSTIMAYVRKYHTSQKLEYLVLHICLCLAHSLTMSCATYWYKGNWKEENNKKGLRKKEESVCGGFVDSSENTKNIINTTQYVHDEWAL